MNQQMFKEGGQKQSQSPFSPEAAPNPRGSTMTSRYLAALSKAPQVVELLSEQARMVEDSVKSASDYSYKATEHAGLGASRAASSSLTPPSHGMDICAPYTCSRPSQEELLWAGRSTHWGNKARAWERSNQADAAMWRSPGVPQCGQSESSPCLTVVIECIERRANLGEGIFCPCPSCPKCICPCRSALGLHVARNVRSESLLPHHRGCT